VLTLEHYDLVIYRELSRILGISLGHLTNHSNHLPPGPRGTCAHWTIFFHL